MPSETVLVDRRGPVTILTIDRPELRNCIDAATADALASSIGTFAEDDDAAVLVVTGAGTTAFCAGADLRDIEGLMLRGQPTAPLGFSSLEPGKPRIAAVEGYCIGGGVELACWCDFRIAGEGALFGAFNRRVGVPWIDGGTQRLPRIVGQGNALYLIETGDEIDARRAYDMGLVQEVVARGRALARAVELAERMAAYPQASLQSDRRAVLGAWGRTLGEGLAFEAEVGLGAGGNPEMLDGARRFVDRRR